MKNKLPLIARILLGLIYFVFGLNGFLNFIPAPATMPEATVAFFNGMMSTGYFFPVLKATETIGGLLLLSGFAAPLALVILAPITIHIALFHGILTPGLENFVMPLLMIILHVAAAMAYWPMYKPLFNRQAYK
ncbi:DoxX family membrane protein [Bdellovibrio bacteriovorus]